MAKTVEKEKARFYRKNQGLSLLDISKKLKVPKSTVRYWCKDILLTQSQIDKLTANQKASSLKAILLYSEKLKKDRILREKKYREIGKKHVGKITKRDLFIAGLSLYWGEGYKMGSGEVGFTNSDPVMISLIIKWFKEIYNIQDKDFILRVSVNNIHKKRIEKILQFWSNHTNLPVSQFTKSSFINTKSKKIYSNNDNYFGVLRVKVRRGTNLLLQIMGSIKALGIGN